MALGNELCAPVEFGSFPLRTAAEEVCRTQGAVLAGVLRGLCHRDVTCWKETAP